MNTHLRGIGFILVSGLFLALNDAIYKSLVPHYPPGQILFINASLVAVIIWLYLKLWRKQGIVIHSRLGHLVRGLLFLIASFAFVFALRHLTLAETVCIAFAGPLFMTLMARQFLGEQVGFVRIAAVLVGFVGVVVIIQPGTSQFRWVLLLPLLVALSDAARDVITRKIAAQESSLTIVWSTSTILALGSLLSLPFGWVEIQTDHLWRWALTVGLTISAYFFMVEAYRYAPTVVIAPFRYIQIIWSILAGVIIWGEIPGVNIYLGVLLTVGAGIFIAWRELQLNAKH